ncbi:hypothetical protein BME96_12455 [Virgibacillus halodenitrificans]|uniref:Rhamnogalacturonase A/B/Epimerase-like pectate lyase domain-containing protein n=1 Tax=Virgibacillus halodenitrificans TaxID=1482 RepID=A0AAC9NLG2_VIRHA|nr:right-handed parallel beta-helix repeat-containing protein [Virgibacillus halodenitrificans]APC48953.1 hypothetical protein BME96_12455 [Virgibacillus halodenitrificans]
MVLKTIPTNIRFPMYKGVEYINEAIKAAERSDTNAAEAKQNSINAENIANQANDKSDYTQTQLDAVTGASTIDPAVEQMKVGSDGSTVYASPDERVRTEHNQVSSQLEDIAINVKSFGAKGDGISDDTIAIQSAIDSLQEGQELFFPKGNYLVSKNTTLPMYPNNDQPCLVVLQKNNVNIVGYGAKLKVNIHAQGVLEIRQSTDVNINGLIVEGCGVFPPLDGNTGRGEKGGSDGGYNTESYWGTKRNNSYDTALGTFKGGIIGNVGIGILVYDGSKRITLKNIETLGFNYCGISIGTFDEDKEYSQDVSIERCYSHDNYSGNFNFHNSKRGSLIASKSENSGHPDSDPVNDSQVNPGYGVVLRQSANYAIDTTIRDSVFINDRRKPIDSHAGEGVFVLNNRIYGGGWGGAIVLFASYSSAKVDNVIVTGNQIENINVHSGFGAGINVEGLPNEKTASCIISDNIIFKSRFNTYHIFASNLKNAKITGNIIKDDLFVGRERCYPITTNNVKYFDISSNFVDISDLLNFISIAPACVNVTNGEFGTITNNTLINYIRCITIEGAEPYINIINNQLLMKNPNLSPTTQHINSTSNKGIVSNNTYSGNIAIANEIKNKLKIKMRVTFNGTVNPMIEVLEGQEYLDGNVDMNTREMIIRFKNNNLSRVPSTNVIFQEALGLPYTDGSTSGRCYQYYAIPNSGITTIGFRPSGSTYTDVKNITSGTIFIDIRY